MPLAEHSTWGLRSGAGLNEVCETGGGGGDGNNVGRVVGSGQRISRIRRRLSKASQNFMTTDVGVDDWDRGGATSEQLNGIEHATEGSRSCVCVSVCGGAYLITCVTSRKRGGDPQPAGASGLDLVKAVCWGIF